MTLQVQTAVATKNMPLNADSSAYNLSDLLVTYLELLGVEYVFGVPGGHISALYEALHRSAQRGGPRAIFARHETGAAHMASGYARETGKLGVCCTTTGPGVTNLITGLMAAYVDRTPLLAITAQSMLAKFGAAAFQESSPDTIDTSAMLTPCTRYNTIITHAKQFEYKLFAALRHALNPPCGPVHLSLPVDLSRMPTSEQPTYAHLMQLLTADSAFVNQAAVEQLWQLVQTTLQQGRKIVIWAGHEAAGATEAIMTFAELLQVRVVTSQRGKSWIDPHHPLVAGVFGFAGHDSARAALADESVDLILAAGTSLGQWATSTWDSVLLNEKFVHIHPVNQYFDYSPMARLHVHGTVRLVFEALIARVKEWQQLHGQPQPIVSLPAGMSDDLPLIPAQLTISNRALYHSDSAPIHPQRLLWEMMQRFPPETRFLTDNCNWLAWTFHHFFAPRYQNFHSTGELAMAMGWAIGAAVGMAMAARGTPVVCLTGDGCFLMNGQEITVAVEECVPVIYVILNDGGYGMVKHRHRQVSRDPLPFGFRRVNFALMAEGMGAVGHAIHTVQDLQALDFATLCRRPGPTVLDVYIDPEATPPMGMF